MGQQHLLLLVLGTVIVGLAVVVGIQSFSENQLKANAGAMINDAIRIASDAQAWKLKPQAFGGGADVSNWTSLTFGQIGYQTNSDGEYENTNGSCVLQDQTSTTLQIVCSNFENGNEVTVEVSGTQPDDITTKVAIGTSGGSS